MSRKERKKAVATGSGDTGHGILFSGDDRSIYSFGERKTNYRLLIAAALLIVLVVLTFRKTTENNFVDWDDFTYVVNNNMVRGDGKTDFHSIFTKPVSSNYHPLTILTMRMNNNRCSDCPNGISPAPFIRGNITLHISNTILVLLLVFLLSNGNFVISFITAALFGVHPMHVESVAWISERKDVLYSFFFLAGLITWVMYRKDEKKHYLAVITFIFFLLSCLSKATAVVFPVVLAVISFWYSGKAMSFRDYLKTALILAPFFLVSIFFGLMAYRIQDGKNFLGLLEISKTAPDVVGSAGPFTLWQKVQTACYGLVMYVVKFFVPLRLSAFYPYPGTAEFAGKSVSILRALSPFIVILAAGAVLYSLKKTKLIAFGTGFFLVTIALVLQFIPVGYAIIAERYSYLPYIGLAFIASALVSWGMRTRKYLFALPVLFIVVMMGLSARQVKVWKNTEKLWSNVIGKYPQVEIARRSRGKYYSKAALGAGNLTDRRMYEERALDDFRQAIRSGSRNAEVYEGAGVIYGSRNENSNAVRFFDTAIRLDPKNGSIYYNRAVTLDRMNRFEEAIRDYNMALIYSPEKAKEIMTNRSNMFLATGKLQQAIIDLDFLISEGTRNPTLYYNRAVARQKLNDTEGAIEDFKKVLQLDPADKDAGEQLRALLDGKK